MEPRIENLLEKQLMDMRVKMTLADNRTTELWQQFMPKRAEITNRLGAHFYSMQVYDRPMDQTFTPNTMFEKWAAVEVANFNDIPSGMESYILSGGKYAVFIHKGSAYDLSTFQYLFRVWLPHSEYELDHREHFELLGVGRCFQLTIPC